MPVPMYDLHQILKVQIEEDFIEDYEDRIDGLEEIIRKALNGEGRSSTYKNDIGFITYPSLPFPDALKEDAKYKLAHLKKYTLKENMHKFDVYFKHNYHLLDVVNWVLHPNLNIVKINPRDNNISPCYRISGYLYDTLEEQNVKLAYHGVCQRIYGIVSRITAGLAVDTGDYHRGGNDVDIYGKLVPNYQNFVVASTLNEALMEYFLLSHGNHLAENDKLEVDQGLTLAMMILWRRCSEYVEEMLEKGWDVLEKCPTQTISSVSLCYQTHTDISGCIIALDCVNLFNRVNEELKACKNEEGKIDVLMDYFDVVVQEDLPKYLEWLGQWYSLTTNKTPSQLMRERLFFITHRGALERRPELTNVRTQQSPHVSFDLTQGRETLKVINKEKTSLENIANTYAKIISRHNRAMGVTGQVVTTSLFIKELNTF